MGSIKLVGIVFLGSNISVKNIMAIYSIIAQH